jgi:hypothetical protein
MSRLVERVRLRRKLRRLKAALMAHQQSGVCRRVVLP